ncbi:hypothetical protein ACFY04_34145 [Streptomyces sp. NPDC001549]|uniref:hypothetical protein n=1 Tax=Streptomyces sp. NPDC001549 TaxID=3364586 RepID=UPI0036A7E5FE
MLAGVEPGLDFAEGVVPAVGVEREEGAGEVVAGEKEAPCVFHRLVDGCEGSLRFVAAVRTHVAVGQGELERDPLCWMRRLRRESGGVPGKFQGFGVRRFEESFRRQYVQGMGQGRVIVHCFGRTPDGGCDRAGLRQSAQCEQAQCAERSELHGLKRRYAWAAARGIGLDEREVGLTASE